MAKRGLEKWRDEPEDMGVYGDEGRDGLVDEDEITPWEAGFMQGYVES
ncbi:hypothetical protein HYU13_00120 [Candidatus Woesearchaeota archaeon]|nr:hypothetical protein [Candidatus Woesearchaeota archaeon]